MEMCGRVCWERECRAGGPFPVSWLFSDCSPAFPCLTVSFFLSFFSNWEVSVSFSCLTSLFVCARARAFLFCSGWLLDFPAPFSLLSICHPHNKYTGMTSVDCRVISSLHVQFDEMKSLLSRWLRWWRAASQQLIDPATLADAKLESTLTNENKKLRYLIADLKSHVKLALALPCELARQNRHVHAGLPRRRTTTRSPTVRLNSKLSKATLTSRTEKISRQNIRLNSCSFTLKERSDSDDMVRQKSSKKQRRGQRKSLAGDAGMLAFCKVRDRGVCSGVCGPRPRAWVCYGTPWQQHGRLRTYAHHVERRRKSSLERRRPSLFWKKTTPGMSDSFETWQEYFWTIDASFKRKKED